MYLSAPTTWRGLNLLGHLLEVDTRQPKTTARARAATRSCGAAEPIPRYYSLRSSPRGRRFLLLTHFSGNTVRFSLDTALDALREIAANSVSATDPAPRSLGRLQSGLQFHAGLRAAAAPAGVPGQLQTISRRLRSVDPAVPERLHQCHTPDPIRPYPTIERAAKLMSMQQQQQQQ